jgi:uroporphyrinogen decarboxylase
MLDTPIEPDYESLLRNLRREGTPKRVHFMELFWDGEIGDAIWERFDLGRDLDPRDPDYLRWRNIRLHRFLGYDYVPVALGNAALPHENYAVAADTAGLGRQGGRSWLDEHTGPIRTMEDFERYPWPDPAAADTSDIEWHSKHVPEDMCLRAGSHSVFEYVTWLMGYEGLCFALHDDPELVDAMFERVGAIFNAWCKLLAQFERMPILFGGDDMGHRTGTMVSAQVLKDKSLVWHQRNAEVAHERGKLYILHACGNLEELMPTLIEQVKLDGKHSFEDVIEPVTVAKRRWGDRLSLIGGIDVDFMCRADEAQVRRRVRETLDICQPGGGYCLGTGNSVTNYIPLENYLAMLDEGRRYAA